MGYQREGGRGYGETESTGRAAAEARSPLSGAPSASGQRAQQRATAAQPTPRGSYLPAARAEGPQPSRPARQGHSCCHFLRGGSSVISGKDYLDDGSPQLGGGSLFSTNEDGGKRYGRRGCATGRNEILEEGPEEGWDQ